MYWNTVLLLDHVHDYLDIFLEFGVAPLLKDIPHYCNDLINKYLPTALKIKAIAYLALPLRLTLGSE